MQQLVAEDGRVLVAWDPAEHPNWPPVDSEGKLIGDVPWKFFDPGPVGGLRTSVPPDPYAPARRG